MIWMVGGRGFYALDLETKETRHLVVSYGGEDGILNSFLADPEKKIFYIEVIQYDFDPTVNYILYDFIQDKIIFESPLFKGNMYPFYNNRLLYCEFLKEEEKSIVKWQVTDLFLKIKEENDLTKEMTKLQIDVWDRTKTLHIGQRMMLGCVAIGSTLTYFSTKWKEDINDFNIEPLTFQIPDETNVNVSFAFSTDGYWVGTTGQKETGMYKIPELFIYNVNGKYPQGLSAPIRCGYTKDLNPGTFMDHSKFGPLYIEQDTDFPKKLFIYKLTDGLKLLSEMVTGK